MKHRNSHFAVGYWSRLRQGRAVPDQADIDPKALKRLLPFVFLLDARGDGSFVYRLAGTTLCDRYGGELRGRNFLSHWDSESRSRLSALLRQSLTTRMPVCLTSIGATEDCRMIEIETVLMPISFGGGEPERFLAVAQVLTDVAPLVGRTITFERLVSSSLIREDEALDHDAPPPPQSGPDASHRHTRAPHLRLVVSQDAGGERDALSAAAEDALKRILEFCGTPAVKAV
jgi:hypothetical protein